MLSEFMRWWGEQLLSLLPAKATAGSGDAILAVLRPESIPGSVDVAIRRRGQQAAMGTFALTTLGMAALRERLGARRLPVELHLPSGMLLEQSVALPLAAERDPKRVLQYEMDRLTPFSADELLWAWVPVRRDRERGQFHICLSLVPRLQVAAVLGALQRAGLHPLALLGASGGRVNLQARQGGYWQRHAVVALTVASLVLAITAAALPFERQREQSRRIERNITALRPAADQAEALRRRMLTAAAGVDVVAAQRASVGNPLQVLATLTNVLPDDTVLTDVALHQRVITISGQSAAAARLIPAMADEPGLRDPVFTAPVTRNETMHAEGFSIRAMAAP